MPGKRENYIDFDTYFMTVALVASERSKDPRTRVGAVIVKDNYIQSIGYNGTPKGMDDDIMPWDSVGEETGDLFQIKNSFVIHAEADALEHLPIGFNPENATLYVTLFPCLECAKRIVNIGIKKVVYLRDYKKEISLVTRKMFEYANVQVEKYSDYNKIRHCMNNILSDLRVLEEKEDVLNRHK